MPRSFAFLGGIAFLLVAIGVTAAVAEGMKSPGPIVVLIILAITYVKVARIVSTSSADRTVPERDERLALLERRVADLQEILLSIDDRIQRAENRAAKSPESV